MSLKQNPAEKLSQIERGNLRYVPYKRACDDPEANFERIRNPKLVKKPAEPGKQAGG